MTENVHITVVVKVVRWDLVKGAVYTGRLYCGHTVERFDANHMSFRDGLVYSIECEECTEIARRAVEDSIPQ